MKLVLYTGPNCGLCDQALDLIQSLALPTIKVEKVNIRESAELYHLYAMRIPVLKNTNNEELAWPFDKDTLQAFVS